MKKLLYHFSDKPWVFNPEYKYDEGKYKHLVSSALKPRGLWLSDEHSELGWSKWCEENDFGSLAYKKAFTLDMEQVLHLKTYRDLVAFTVHYDKVGAWSERGTYLDWQRVKKAYAGLLITPYCYEARLELMWYYGWDCASACIWDLSVLKEEEGIS